MHQVSFIAFPVARDFITPKFSIRFRQRGFRTVQVSMPKASVDKNYGPIFFQYNVGFARQSGVVQTKPKACGKQILSYYNFRLRVLAGNARHNLASLAFRKNISQDVLLNAA